MAGFLQKLSGHCCVWIVTNLIPFSMDVTVAAEFRNSAYETRWHCHAIHLCVSLSLSLSLSLSPSIRCHYPLHQEGREHLHFPCRIVSSNFLLLLSIDLTRAATTSAFNIPPHLPPSAFE